MPEDEDDIHDLAAEPDEEPTIGLDAWPDEDMDGRAVMRACPVYTVPRGMELSE